MLDYKAKHNKFPSTYNDMVAFLDEVHIQLFFHSIRLAYLYLKQIYLLNARVLLKLVLELGSHLNHLASLVYFLELEHPYGVIFSYFKFSPYKHKKRSW